MTNDDSSYRTEVRILLHFQLIFFGFQVHMNMGLPQLNQTREGKLAYTSHTGKL